MEVHKISILRIIVLIFAFQISFAKGNVVIAVIDSGLNLGTPGVNEKNIWINNGEIGFDYLGHSKASNHLDDDMNGYIDDVNGWNFLSSSKNISDPIFHGTPIICIMSKLLSIRDSVRIMPIKALSNDKSAVPRAIHYAIKMEASVINLSLGGKGPEKEEEKAIQRAVDQGIVVIASMSNDENEKNFFPAAYNISNMVKVTSVRKNILNFKDSAEGKNTVLVPVKYISNCEESKRVSGNSFATAIVSVAVAKYLNRSREPFSIEKITKHTADFGPVNVLDVNKLFAESNTVPINFIFNNSKN